MDSGVTQFSFLSPAFYCSFMINSQTKWCTYSHADDSALCYSTSFTKRSSPQKLVKSRLDVAGLLYFEWEKELMCPSVLQKSVSTRDSTQPSTPPFPFLYELNSQLCHATIDIIELVSTTRYIHWKLQLSHVLQIKFPWGWRDALSPIFFSLTDVHYAEGLRLPEWST